MERKIQKRISEYRKDRGLTLQQLAERAGCTPSYISQLEKGLTVPSLSMVGGSVTKGSHLAKDIYPDQKLVVLPEASTRGETKLRPGNSS